MRELHRNQSLVRSHNRSTDVQCKTAIVVKQNRPLDHHSDRRSGGYLMSRRYQRAVTADVYRLGCTADVVWSVNFVTGTKFDGKAGSASTFRASEVIQVSHRLFRCREPR